MEAKGTLKFVAKNGTGFKIAEDNDWFNADKAMVDVLAGVEKGAKMTLIYENKGKNRVVSEILVDEEAVAEKGETSTKFTCNVCGKELKDGKYKTCFMCNKKGVKSKVENKVETTSSAVTEKKEWKSNYGSAEDVAGKEIGCAVGAAATVAGGQQFSDVDAAAEYTLILAQKLLDWIRGQK
ncbi:MAG: hypothetical protein KKA19_06280 [Candidatus Margulisbacteria bacterium]|nr:hypothetical protein [Candidatus Margulisiibacteriota bacterium]